MVTPRIASWALAAALCASGAPRPARAAGPVRLDLDQLLERNAAARGGLEAWRKVQTMVWSGHVERADGSGQGMPFVFYQKRPNLTRFELVVEQNRTLRVFDGQQGWKVRPTPGGRPETQPYGEEERRAALDAPVIDGPVLDARARGIRLALEGLDEVEGRQAYRLGVRFPSGAAGRVWIDAETFLEVKQERPALDAGGRPSTVAVYLRNYKAFDGLQIPFAIETAPAGGPVVDRLVIDRIAVGPPLPDGMFARPGLRTSRRGITVDTRQSPGQGAAAGWPAGAPRAAAGGGAGPR